MNKATEEKLVSWLCAYPDSNHPLDERRMYDFVREACYHHDKVTLDLLRKVLEQTQPQWEEAYKEHFLYETYSLIDHLMAFYSFCVNNETVEEDIETEHIVHVPSLNVFMDSVDLDYHEIYELHYALNGLSEALNFFTVKETNDTRTIIYNLMPISLSFRKTDTDKLTAWLEKHYMNGYDADTWYGFEIAMEKEKNEK